MFRSAISILKVAAMIRFLVPFGLRRKWKPTGITVLLTINSLDVTSIRIPAIEGQDTIDYIDELWKLNFPGVAGANLAGRNSGYIKPKPAGNKNFPGHF